MRSTIGLALCFLLLAVVLVAAAWVNGGWYYLLIYPAISLAIVALGYFRAGPSVFGKRVDGQRHWLASWLLGPYLLFAYVTWHCVRLVSREWAIDEVHPDLLLSRRLLSSELPKEVKSVVDLTCELSDPKLIRQVEQYVCFPMLDALGVEPDELLELVEEILQLPNPVLIHCAQGHGRTGLVAAAVLLVSGQVRSAAQAIDIVKCARPGIQLSDAQRRALQALQEKCVPLRFDGIYSDFDGAMHRHLRFFENGKVIFILIALSASEVVDGFNEKYHEQCGGMFQLAAGQISFIVTDYGFGNREDIVVEYNGEVGVDCLMLDVYSHTTQHRSSRWFNFYPDVAHVG